VVVVVVGELWRKFATRFRAPLRLRYQYRHSTSTSLLRPGS
jgi:hypothetical protein